MTSPLEALAATAVKAMDAYATFKKPKMGAPIAERIAAEIEATRLYREAVDASAALSMAERKMARAA